LIFIQNYRQQQQNNNQGQLNQNNQNKPNNAGPQQQRTGNKQPLKFENEFDFEQANSKFEELRATLAKLKVGLEETKTPDQVN
jgi:protein LSM14